MNTNGNTSFAYKSREESLLIENLLGSKLISKEQLLEIKKLYHESVPYHNFIHALKVAQGVLSLPSTRYNIIEIRSLFIAALFHDAWHKWVAEDLDEFRSLDMAFQWIIDFEQKYDYSGIDYSIVRKAIMWTVFKNRGNNKDSYAILLADLDVSTIWMDFAEFLYYCDFPISIEFWVEIEDWIRDVNYFKFLTSINKNIFRCESMRTLYPNALWNIRKYIGLGEEHISELFTYWKQEDITFEEFRQYYEKNYI